MAVAVLVPWRPGDEHREAAWAWVRARYESAHPGWQVIEGTPPAGPWVKALAVEDALERTDADLLVIADADVWCDGLTEAAEAVTTWAVPHHRVHRLTREATAAVLAGDELGGAVEQPAYRGYEGGGITIVTRTVYERCRLDPRFVGWGQEDEAWALALRTLHGPPWRGTAPLWHLWHPPQERLNRHVGSKQGSELLHRYRRARHGGMDRLVTEPWRIDGQREREGQQPRGAPDPALR